MTSQLAALDSRKRYRDDFEVSVDSKRSRLESTKDFTIIMLGFLGDGDLRVASAVSKYFKECVKFACQRVKIGPDFIRKVLGEVGEVPRIPEVFLERAQIGFKLVFIPETITVEVDQNSPWMLSDHKESRLILNPEKIGLNPTGEMREMEVPATVNNLIFLALQKCIRFQGLFDCWDNILDQHGDVTAPSHWSYQKEDVLGENRCFFEFQRAMVDAAGLEIVSLRDRCFFHLLSHMNSGKSPENRGIRERTSTPTLDNDGNDWDACLDWPRTGPLFYLRFQCRTIPRDGVAVGMPAIPH